MSNLTVLKTSIRDLDGLYSLNDLIKRVETTRNIVQINLFVLILHKI